MAQVCWGTDPIKLQLLKWELGCSNNSANLNIIADNLGMTLADLLGSLRLVEVIEIRFEVPPSLFSFIWMKSDFLAISEWLFLQWTCSLHSCHFYKLQMQDWNGHTANTLRAFCQLALHILSHGLTMASAAALWTFIPKRQEDFFEKNCQVILRLPKTIWFQVENEFYKRFVLSISQNDWNSS